MNYMLLICVMCYGFILLQFRCYCRVVIVFVQLHTTGVRLKALSREICSQGMEAHLCFQHLLSKQ